MVTFFKEIPKPIWVFTLIWFVTGCVQSWLMDLHPDEAYQWQVSQYLDWGFFHHPPMIAVFIKIGYAIFPNELGVRLMTVLSSSLSIPLLYKLSETKHIKVFLLIFLSLILTQAGVFFAAPDSALSIFAVVFLLLLKKYLKEDSYGLAALLAICIAALMYSKYHAIILFASALVAVPKLLLRKSFWFLGVLSVLLFLPHVLWQFDNDLVSYKFNWVIREKKSWNVMILLDYLIGQLILLTPVGIILVMSILKTKFNDRFDRVLLSIAVGFFGFFLVMSLRGKVEANWTAVGFLPLIILGARTLPLHARLQRTFTPVAIVFAVILIVARIYLASPWAGIGLPTVHPLRGWKQWADTIKVKAEGRPVFFTNSYQNVSQYSFYSGEQGYHVSLLNYNGNQFELWNFDTLHRGKPFALVTGIGVDTTNEIRVEGFKTLRLHKLDNYTSYRNLRFEFDQTEYSARSLTSQTLEGQLLNGTTELVNLDSLFSSRTLHVLYYLDGKLNTTDEVQCIGCNGQLKVDESKSISLKFQIPESKGKYFIRFGLDFALEMPEQNSDFVKFMVTE